MEYNYTKELKQPIKFYQIGGYPLSFAPNGIQLQHIIVFGVVLLLVLVVFIIGWIKGSDFLTTLFTKSWILIIAVVGLIVWTIFTLKWDNKSFLSFVFDRLKYRKIANITFEHGQRAPHFDTRVTYQKKKKGRT